MTALTLDDVTVRYGSPDQPAAIAGLSLSVQPGEVVAVVGPSGSGKSTLLRAVAGLEPLAGGRILFDDVDQAGVPTHRRGLGLMFQDHALFSHLSVAGNVAYGLRMQGVDGATRDRKVAELLELVGLAGFGPRPVNALSGGEGQRVALARALAPEPRLLMLDEPLGSLDRALRAQLTADLRRLLSELDQTAIHVTHDQAEAFEVADRVAVVIDGRLVRVGAPAELWADPGSARVARFLGHANVWDVAVDGRGTIRLTTPDQSAGGHGDSGDDDDDDDGDSHGGGVVLGRVEPGSALADAGAGSHTVLVPLTALSVVDDATASMTLLADEVRFSEGRHRVIGRPVGGGGDAKEWSVEVVTDRPVRPGERLTVEIVLDQVRPLG